MSEDLHHLSEAENESFVPLRSSVLLQNRVRVPRWNVLQTFTPRPRQSTWSWFPANYQDQDHNKDSWWPACNPLSFSFFCINSFLNFPKALQSLKKCNNKSCKGTSFVWFSCMLIELHWFRATFEFVGWVKVKKSILGHGYKEISRRWAAYPLLNYSGRIM